MRTLLPFFFYALLFSYEGFAQRVVLSLVPREKPPFATPYRYREVLDHRIDKSAIGEVFERAGHKIPVVINGNLEQSARRFFSQSITPDDSAEKEIQVRILNLELTEKYNPETDLYEGDVQLGIGFFVIGGFDPVHLLDYSGSIQYQRSGFRMDKVEDVLNRLFYNSLVYFDSWLRNQTLSNRALASEFRLDIIEGSPVSTVDKVYYKAGSPLVWENFRARPSPTSRNNATIFTSFSVQGISMMDSGSVVQTLEVEVYMLPMQSWVKVPGDYALNHEQRHFDIVRIAADRLIHRLKVMGLDLDFYQTQINEAYLDAYREMNRLQEFYETQTAHGIDRTGQERWNQWIDEALGGDWRRIDSLLLEASR